MERDASNRQLIDGVVLAEFARQHSRAAPDPSDVGRSARTRLVGLVTSVTTDRVMSQVAMHCGPHRIVSHMSTQAVQELGPTVTPDRRITGDGKQAARR